MIMAFTACQLMLRPALDSRWTAGICLNPHTAQGAKYCCQVQGSISQEKNTACSELHSKEKQSWYITKYCSDGDWWMQREVEV